MSKNAPPPFARGCGPRVERARASVAIVLGGVLLAGCAKRSGAPEGFQGIVEYDDRVIGFEEPGRVLEVPIARGDVVHAGDVLAKLDPTIAQATRAARQADADAARAELELLRAGTRREDVTSAAADVASAAAAQALMEKYAARARELVRSGALPKAEADKADADLEQATARRRSLEARLLALRRGSRPEQIAAAEARSQEALAALALEDAKLARYVLRAPVAGSVLDLLVKGGEMAAVGSPAITMADTEHPYADVFVPQGQLAGIVTGAPALLAVDSAPDAFHAVVEHVSPETEFTPKFLFSDRERPNLVIRVRVRIDDGGRRLHSGVPAFVRFPR
jgi:HlyD family secretion protein